jgi:cysteine synthase A
MNKNNWSSEAVALIAADFNRSADTHLFKAKIPSLANIDFYFKDESTHPTGSLKHRLARSLFLYGLCNGWIRENTTIVEASSGSTAVSEAYFAKLLGLPFIAVMPKATSLEKITKVTFYGGKVQLIDDSSKIYDESERIAKETGGHFMNQFLFAERATDWRGNNNIAESIFQQMAEEQHPVPAWLVCGAGTGGTSATLGRFVRYQGFETQVCVVDPENSVFAEYFATGNAELRSNKSSMIEGIGRPRVEPSFIRQALDRVIQVPDAASFAAMRFLENLIGKKCGGSTGTNFYGTLILAHEMVQRKQSGSLVTLICDSGDRYLQTYFSDDWLNKNGFEIQPYLDQISKFVNKGIWEDVRKKEPKVNISASQASLKNSADKLFL